MRAIGIGLTPFFATVLALGATQLGCQTMDITSDWDPAIDFSKLSTYDWMPDPEPGGPGINDSLTRDRVYRAVDRVLADRGYVHHVSGTPDFLVGYYGAVETRLDVRSLDDYYGYRPGWSGPGYRRGIRTYVREYDQGTLILDISDPHTSKLMWRGSAQAEVDRKRTPYEREATINEAVNRILEHFPPSSSRR